MADRPVSRQCWQNMAQLGIYGQQALAYVPREPRPWHYSAVRESWMAWMMHTARCGYDRLQGKQYTVELPQTIGLGATSLPVTGAV